jgi:hypothetical protein
MDVGTHHRPACSHLRYSVHRLVQLFPRMSDGMFSLCNGPIKPLLMQVDFIKLDLLSEQPISHLAPLLFLYCRLLFACLLFYSLIKSILPLHLHLGKYPDVAALSTQLFRSIYRLTRAAVALSQSWQTLMPLLNPA